MSPAAGDAGVAFPPGPDGRPSSRLAGTRILAAALAASDPAHARDALAEPRWRHAYPLHFRRLVEGGLRDAATAVAAARAGLAAAGDALAWDGPDGPRPLHDALAAAPPAAPRTVRVVGGGDPAPAPWTVPYRGELLQGGALEARLDDWQARGIVEPGAADALRRCAAHPEWFDLSDRTLVLLGAGSEAGPLRWLARWRARIAAVDLPGEARWRRIAQVVREGNATLLAPVAGAAATGDDPASWAPHAGVDLIAQAPRAVAWLRTLDGPLDVAALGYADGERHLRLSAAMDLVQAAACEADARTTLAWMATPTDVFAVPEATARRAIAAWDARSAPRRAAQAPLQLATGDRLFHPNVERTVRGADGLAWGIVDALVVQQGPNYALAKRLQQWRALAARADGRRCSLNVAPSTMTASVVAHPAFAAGFAGASVFGVEAFEPETTNALAAALWVHDLRCDASAANPARALAHPFERFSDAACHGGLWTCAYRPRSALPLAAVVGWWRGAGRPPR